MDRNDERSPSPCALPKITAERAPTSAASRNCASSTCVTDTEQHEVDRLGQVA